jgi:hypothetical protein
MRQAKLVRHRLDMPGEEVLMPDRTGLHDLALLDAVKGHPVVVLRLHPLLQCEQPFRSSHLKANSSGRIELTEAR